MPSKTATQRIINHVSAYGVATPKELEDKYDVTQQHISNMINNLSYPVMRVPTMIITTPGNYLPFKKTAQTPASDIETLKTVLEHLMYCYDRTHHEEYKRYAEICTRKLIAAAIHTDARIKAYTPIGSRKLNESNEDTELADRFVRMIKTMFKTGEPQF